MHRCQHAQRIGEADRRIGLVGAVSLNTIEDVLAPNSCILSIKASDAWLASRKSYCSSISSGMSGSVTRATGLIGFGCAGRTWMVGLDELVLPPSAL